MINNLTGALRPRAILFVLIALMAAAVMLRGGAFFGRAYPTGADYGHHFLYAEQVLETGWLPTDVPYFQLGQTEWSVLPGGSLTYTLLGALTGVSLTRLAPFTLIFVVIEVGGVFLLAHRLFANREAGLIAAGVAALSPAGADIMAWAGYPNVIALSLMPYVLWAWLAYWEKPTARTGLLAALLLVGVMAVHHLSTLWIVLALGVFSVGAIIAHPRASLRRLIPFGLGCAVLGWPIALRIINLGADTGAANILLSSDRFDVARLTWSQWAQVASPWAIVFLAAGVPALLFNPRVTIAGRGLIAAYLLISLGFAFGWLFGLSFFYTRAIFFLTLPAAIGAAALLTRWRARWVRFGLAAVIAVSLTSSAAHRADGLIPYYSTLTPQVIDGVTWLRANSAADDVVVVATFLGFHMTRELQRPTLVGLTPELIGNPQEFAAAADAVSILMGLESMDQVIADRGVRWVLLKSSQPDSPDSARSQAVMNAHPRMRLAYRNRDVIIYEVVDE